jgi:nitrite reductase (NO-forming)
VGDAASRNAAKEKSMRRSELRGYGVEGMPTPGGYGRLAARALIMGAFAAIVAGGVAPAHAASRTFKLSAESKDVPVGAGLKFRAWTYDGEVPGPVLRARQGDMVHIHLTNRTTEAHGIEVQAAQIAPKHFVGDPMKPVDYTFPAEVPGVFSYHCAANPILEHIALGMYGMMIVEPKDGWPDGPAQDVELVQSEIYGLPDAQHLIISNQSKVVAAQPDFVLFNGDINKYDLDHPIQIKVGKLVRVFFLNAGPSLTAAFHVSGVIFSTVYQGGNPADARHGLTTVEVPPGAGAVFEFRVTEPGDYQFTDSSRAHEYKGAMGIFRAVP